MSQSVLKLMLAGCCLVASIASTWAQVVYVAPGATGTGTSWADASGDLAEVMSAATPGTSVWLKQGTYFPAACADTSAVAPCDAATRRQTFVLRPGVTLIGGFTGVKTTATAADATNITILSGDIDGDSTLANNSFSVLTCAACGTESSVANLRITAGNADGSAPAPTRLSDDRGAGVFIQASFGEVASPSFTNVVVANNFAKDGGGGVHINAQGNIRQPGTVAPTFKRCRIDSNATNHDGGGIRMEVQGFDADGSTSSVGNLLLEDCSISYNTNTYLAGFSGDNFGGGLHVKHSQSVANVTLRRTRIHRNISDAFAAADSTSDAGVDIGDLSTSNGGGIYVLGNRTGEGLLRIENCVISHNKAYAGAAMYINRSNVEIDATTIVYNKAVGEKGNGGGVYVNGGNSDTPNGEGASGRITNSIIFGNTEKVAENGSEALNQVGSTLYVEYTLIDKDTCDSGIRRDETDAANYTNEDPDVQSTLTCGAGMIYRPFVAEVLVPGDSLALPVLPKGSPAINTGQPDSVRYAIDFTGGQRVISGRIDLGALEYLPPPPLPAVVIDSFAARADTMSISLEWFVHDELNLAGYILERSDSPVDSSSFVQLDSIAARGDTSYNLIDSSTTLMRETPYYYRLMAVALDGRRDTAQVVSATLPKSTSSAVETNTSRVVNQLQVYPNPAQGWATVTLMEATHEQLLGADLSLIDAQGKTVRSWQLVSDSQLISLERLPSGWYTLQLFSPAESWSTRLLLLP